MIIGEQMKFINNQDNSGDANMTGKINLIGLITLAVVSTMFNSGCMGVMNNDGADGKDFPVNQSMIRYAFHDTPAGLNDGMMREITAMSDEMLAASNYLDLAEKAGEVSARLAKMHLANIGSPDIADYLNRIRSHVEIIRARAVIAGNIYSAEDHFTSALSGKDPDTVITAAENVINSVKKATVRDDLFSAGELVIFDQFKIDAERNMVLAMLHKILTNNFNISQHAHSAEKSIKACEDSAAAIKRMVIDRSDLFDHDQRKYYMQVRGDWLKEAGHTRKIVQAAEQELMQQRKIFINDMAAKDLKEAKKYFEAENNKFWFNFFGIRENGDNLIRAILHADRVEQSQAAYALRDQASIIGSKSREALWSKEKRQLDRRPKLPSYDNHFSWPKLDMNTIRNKKDKTEELPITDIKTLVLLK